MLGKIPKPEELADKYSDKLNRDEIMNKIRSAGKKLGCKAVKIALTLYYAMQSPTVPAYYKAMAAGALAYFGLPLDAIPDFVPVAGLSDDITVMGAAVAIITVMMDAESKAKADKKLHEWFAEDC